MEDLLWLVSFSEEDDRELTTLEIGNALADGQISHASLVWRDGMPEWRSLGEVEELAPTVARHNSMVAALAKRQTVLGGFRAAASEGGIAAVTAQLSALPAAPPATLTRGEPAAPASAEAEPPTLRPSAQPRDPESETPLALTTEATPTAYVKPPVASSNGSSNGLKHTVDSNTRHRVPHPTTRRDTLRMHSGVNENQGRNLGGFQAVPVRRRLSSSSGLDVAALEEADSENRRSDIPKDRATTPPGIPAPHQQRHAFADLDDDDEDTPVSLDSSTLETLDIPSFGSSARPSAPNHAAPSGPAVVPLEFSTEHLEQTAPIPTPMPLHRKPDPRPPLRSTVPPSNPIRWSVETTGTQVQSEKPQPVSSGNGKGKRWFLGAMALTAAASVALLLFRPSLPAPGSENDKHQTASQVFAAKARAVEPAAPEVVPQVIKTEASVPAVEVAGKASAVAVTYPATKPNPAIETRPETVAPKALVAKVPSAPRSDVSVASRPATALANVAPVVNKPPQATAAQAAAPSAPKSAAVSPNAAAASAAAEPALIAAFDRDAASGALDRAATEAGACRKSGDPSGVARVSVTFSETGKATMAIVDGPPFAGTQTGSCIAESMRKTRIPAFSGDRVTVKKTVVIH